MDGIHDMGGTQGWGSVTIDPDERVFKADWERKAFAFGALSSRMAGTNLDAMRHAIDRQHPYDYLVDGYFGRWLGSVETLLVESGLLAPGAVEARARRLRGEDVDEPSPPAEPHKPDYQPTGPGSLRQTDRAPRFEVGDRVTAKDHAPAGHTRLARYVRGHTGTVVLVQPAHVLPDTHAHFLGENPQPVYAVRFDSKALWGDDADDFTVTVDLYDDYLEAIR